MSPEKDDPYYYMPETSYPDDVFLVSYPKSGNTWLRFLLGNYITGNKCDFTTAHLIIPDIHYNPKHCSEIQRPRLIKSHMPYVPEYRRVVYLVRDGRDVAVSYYFHSMKYSLMKKDSSFEEFLDHFNRGAVDDFGLWVAHVHSWLDHGPKDFLLVRYEDLKADPESLLIRILEFAGVPADHDTALRAIEASRFEKMRDLEKKQHHQFDRLSNSDPAISFVRKGEVGDYQNHFNNILMQKFLAVHGGALERLNYIQRTEKSSPRLTQNIGRGGGEKTCLNSDRKENLPDSVINIVIQALDQLNNAGENEAALALFEEAGRQRPDLVGIDYGKAVALARLDRKALAMEILRDVVAKPPGHEKAKVLLSELTSQSHAEVETQGVFEQTSVSSVRISSPLTGSNHVTLDREVPCSLIIESYRNMGIDVRRFFENLDRVQVYKCEDSGYRFYYPFTLEGDTQLYEELENLPGYYMDWKWEHEIASRYIKSTDRVLEIGCGRGGFLEKMQQNRVQCLGLELNGSAVRTALSKGVHAIIETIQDHARDNREAYGVVCSFQVAEHVAEIRTFMEASLETLKPGGKLILSVPNNDAFVFRCDDFQPLNRPPHHMGLWDISSLIGVTKVFPLRLDGIEIEPLQAYHREWAQSILERRLIQQWRKTGEEMVKYNRAVVTTVAQLIFENAPGHTILVHYTKM